MKELYESLARAIKGMNVSQIAFEKLLEIAFYLNAISKISVAKRTEICQYIQGRKDLISGTTVIGGYSLTVSPTKELTYSEIDARTTEDLLEKGVLRVVYKVDKRALDRIFSEVYPKEIAVKPRVSYTIKKLT